MRATQFPCPLGLATGQSTAIIHQVGEAIAKELAAVGINWNLVPVVDILTQLTEPLDAPRRFGDDAETVSNNVLAFTEGLHEAGILACASEALASTLQETYRRSLADEALDDGALELLETGELLPLRRLLNHQALDSVLLSNMVHEFKESAEASDSIETVIHNVLRKSLGFEGPVIIDCSSLPVDGGSCAVHAPLRALLSGSDMIRLPTNYQTQIASINAIYAALEDSLLSSSQIVTSASRISNLKSRYISNPQPDILPSLINRHAPLAQIAYRSSITTLQPTPSTLPFLPSTAVLLLLTPTVPNFYVSQQQQQQQQSDPFEPLGRAISRTHPRTRHVPYTLTTGLTSTHMAFLHRASAVILVLACASSTLIDAQGEVWSGVEAVLAQREAASSGNEKLVRIVVGAGDVRDLLYFLGQQQRALLGTGWWGVRCWDWTRGAVEAVGEVLVGEREASAVSPFARWAGM